jgi:acetyl-CoA synthetase
MSEHKLYPVPDSLADAHISADDYAAMYRRSIDDRDAFFAEMATQFLDWDQPWSEVCSFDFTRGEANWFAGGRLNVSVNCIDRHLPARADQTAIIWEGDDAADIRHISYRELHEEVGRLGNALRARGVGRGDRVCLYMPMIPEAAYAMLACARIGAIHTVVFGGFSPEALKDRIQSAECCAVITADEGLRGGKTVPLKFNTDRALEECPTVHSCIVVRRTGGDVAMQEGRDHYYHELTAVQATDCAPESMDSEDPLFILYTSGSTGKPKGVLHTTAGYLLQAAMSFKYVFDYREGEVYWCTADVGWVTGHSYIVYGPLANGATTLMFEGVPTYPDAGRCWDIVDRHQVASFYTAPTAIRALQGMGDDYVTRYERSSLRILGTVGEPINPEAWEWYYHTVGDARCPDCRYLVADGNRRPHDHAAARRHALKPGSATLPFFGVELALLNEDGSEIEGAGAGYLVVKRSWPSQIRSVYGDHQRMVDTYFSNYPGYYFTGDGASRDEDGYYWITGRVDDVLNVSRATAWAPRKSRAPWCCTRRSPRPPWSAIRTISRARVSIATSPRCRVLSRTTN